VSGVYGAGSAGAAIINGAQAVILTNQNGAVLELTGRPPVWLGPGNRPQTFRRGAWGPLPLKAFCVYSTKLRPP
jgi:hypothetical protein